MEDGQTISEEYIMSQSVTIQLEMPDDLKVFRLPEPVNQRLQELLDQQDRGAPLSTIERQEAEALVDMAELLTLLRLRAQRAFQGKTDKA